MAHNFLEQLVAEWYEYQGFFIRRNVLVGKRSKGGHECELDVLAFNPNTRTVVHIEPSMDAQSWADREKRYKKKFDAGRKHIPRIFESLGGVDQIQQIALFVFASDKTHQQIGGGQILLVQHLLLEIFHRLKETSVAKSAVPEQYPLIRMLQMVSDYKGTLFPPVGI